MMNRLFIVLGLLVVPFCQIALAQQNPDEHASHHSEPASPGQPGAAAPSASPASDKFGELLQNMKKIQELMKRIHATTDPAAKEALMNDHLRALREEMRGLLAASPGTGMGMMAGGAKEAEGSKMDDPKAAKPDAGGQEPAPPGKPPQKPDMKGGDMMGGGMMRGDDDAHAQGHGSPHRPPRAHARADARARGGGSRCRA